MENLRDLISSIRSLSMSPMQPQTNMRQNSLLESRRRGAKKKTERLHLPKNYFCLSLQGPTALFARQHRVFVLSHCLAGNSPFADDFQRRYQGALEGGRWRSLGTMLNYF